MFDVTARFFCGLVVKIWCWQDTGLNLRAWIATIVPLGCLNPEYGLIDNDINNDICTSITHRFVFNVSCFYYKVSDKW